MDVPPRIDDPVRQFQARQDEEQLKLLVLLHKIACGLYTLGGFFGTCYLIMPTMVAATPRRAGEPPFPFFLFFLFWRRGHDWRVDNGGH